MLMNSQLMYEIPDTAEHLSEEEIECIKIVQKMTMKGIMAPTNIPEKYTELAKQLVTKHFLAAIQVGDMTFIYDPQTMHMSTYAVKLKKYKTMKDADTGEVIISHSDEQIKKLSRRLISHWILGTNTINMKMAAHYIYMFTWQIHAIISVPEFLDQLFQIYATAAKAKITELTQKRFKLRCNWCAHNFTSTIESNEFVCPNCNKTVIH